MINSKKGDKLRTLTAGDRVCWHADIQSAWGTVTSVKEIHTVQGVNGPVFTGITVILDCPHFPTYDKYGYPVDEPRTVTRRFNKLTDYEIEYAYTPRET